MKKKENDLDAADIGALQAAGRALARQNTYLEGENQKLRAQCAAQEVALSEMRAQMDAWRRNYEAECERRESTLRLTERLGVKGGKE